jgi:hypothetical protein
VLLLALATVCAASTAFGQAKREGASTGAKDGSDAAYDLRKLEFMGVHNVRLPSHSHQETTLQAIGQFIVEGPRVETLRPVNVGAGVVPGAIGELFFYASSIAGRIDSKTGAWSRFSDESIGRQPFSLHPTAMAFDARRQRLLISSETELYAYDPKAKRWLWRKNVNMRFVGLAYDQDNDLFHGITAKSLGSNDPFDPFVRARQMNARRGGEQSGPNRLSLTSHRITPEGEIAGQVAVSEPLSVKSVPERIQTAFSEGLLVLLADESLFAIRPANGQVVYKGLTRLIRDGKPWEPLEDVELSVEQRHEQLKKRIAALTQQLQPAKAAALAARVDYLSRCLAGRFADKPVLREPEIHAVGLHNVARPDRTTAAICPVTITHAAAPIILIVSAYEATTWRLEIGPDVQIEQIVICGYNRHRVEGAPDGTRIIDRSQLEQPSHYMYVAPAQTGGRSREGFSSLAHAMFGSAPMSFQYESNKSSFQIGPEEDPWRESYLNALARSLERELLLAENESFEFTALLRKRRRDTEASALAAFTFNGPKEPPTEWLPEPFVFSARGRKDNELFVVDRKNHVHAWSEGSLKALQSPEAASPGRTTALAFDRRRQRLLAWHSRENRDKNSVSSLGKAIIAYDIANRSWEQIGAPSADTGAVAIDEQKDLQYGLVLPTYSNAIHDFVVTNAQGAVLGSVPLEEPIYWDLEAGPPQAVFARGHLIVLTPPQAALLPDGKERLVSQVIAINPANGQTFFTGRYFCD